jgi:hypothetical protein
MASLLWPLRSIVCVFWPAWPARLGDHRLTHSHLIRVAVSGVWVTCECYRKVCHRATLANNSLWALCALLLISVFV